PITPVVFRIAEQIPPYREGYERWLKAQILDLTRLEPGDREALLQYVAIATYRANGPYSLGTLGLLIVQARMISVALAFFCAMVLNMPVMAGAVFAGGFIGRKLVERDHSRDLLTAERRSSRVREEVSGVAAELWGREDFIDRLIRLSGRGWSTI